MTHAQAVKAKSTSKLDEFPYDNLKDFMESTNRFTKTSISKAHSPITWYIAADRCSLCITNHIWRNHHEDLSKACEVICREAKKECAMATQILAQLSRA